MHGTNLLNQVTHISLGSVAGTPSFGRPLAALAGRSFRVSLDVD